MQRDKTPKPETNKLIRTRRFFCGSAGLWLFCLVTSQVGCTAASKNNTVLSNPHPLPAEAYSTAFVAGVEVLRDAGFEIDRQDFRFGRITSKPKGSPTIFEPWKPDNTYGDQAVRSTLGNLRRTVALSFDPETPGQGVREPSDDSPPRAYRLEVEVLLERLQTPKRRMNGAAHGAVFADLGEVPAELQGRGITDHYWQPIGRDLHLEQRLLEKILNPPQPDSR